MHNCACLQSEIAHIERLKERQRTKENLMNIFLPNTKCELNMFLVQPYIE